MKVYTRTGDKGKTSLFSGERVYKDDLRVDAYGTLDELNSALGVALNTCSTPRVKEILAVLQRQLFTAGADLATHRGGHRQPPRISEDDWRQQEALIDELSSQLPELKRFVLPGGSPGSAQLQVARSVCRRAERLIVRLGKEDGDVNPALLIYVNRLSDLLFVMARHENVSLGLDEILWEGRR